MKGQRSLGWRHIHTLPHLGAGGREDQELETNLLGSMEIESILNSMKSCPKKWTKNCSCLRNIFTRWGTPGHPNPVLPSDLDWPICSQTTDRSQHLKKGKQPVLGLGNVFSASSSVAAFCSSLPPLVPFPKSVVMFGQQLKSFFH